MKRIISILLVLTCFMSMFALCAEAVNYTPYYYEQREQFNMGSGTGFYNNVGYYINKYNKKLYVKTSLNGTSKAVRGNVVPDMESDEAFIGGISSAIYKGYVYYLGKNRMLYKCAVNGKYHKLLNKNLRIHRFIITNNRIVFVAKDKNGNSVDALYCCDLNGKNGKRIVSNFSCTFYSGIFSWGTNLFFFNDRVNALQHYSFKTNKVYTDKKIDLSGNIYAICMDNKYFYFKKIVNDSYTVLYRIDTATRVMQKLLTDTRPYECSYVVAGNKIYKQLGDNFFRYNAKTKKFVLIKSFSKNTVGSMGFYQNYLVAGQIKNDKPTYKYYLIDKV